MDSYMPDTKLPTLKAKDFSSDQDVRWCPGFHLGEPLCTLIISIKEL